MPGTFILLVEDDVNDEATTVHALRQANVGNQLEIVRDGGEALDFVFARGAYAERDPDALPSIVLLDLRLPKVDGVDVLKALRANERTRTLPVVVLTSSQDQRDVLASYEFGAYAYVRKPLSFGEFSAATSRLGLHWFLNEQPARAGTTTTTTRSR